MSGAFGSFRPFELEELPTLADALARWGEAVPVLRPPVEQVDLSRAWGRVLGADVVASQPVPAFPRSMMDGVAVRSADTQRAGSDNPVTLSLVGRVEMGKAPSFSIREGEAALVPTGGMMPDGADAVVIVEEFPELLGSGQGARGGPKPTAVAVRRAVEAGENTSPAGSDVAAGQVVLRRGHRIRPQDVGVLAGLGRVTVPVYRRPEVAILSTGSEVISPEKEPGPGQIRDMNAVALAALVRKAGGRPRLLGIAGDERSALREALESGLQSDMLVLSGGSSVGEEDWTARLLAEMGEPGIIIHGVKLAPGKPTLCALIGNRPVVGLPGNPVSALIVFELFARPALQAISGEIRPQTWRAAVSAQLETPVVGAKGRELHLRVALVLAEDGTWRARPVRGGSNRLMTMVEADGVIVIPADTEWPAGMRVDVYPW